MKPTVDEFIEHMESARCITFTQAQKVMIKKFYENYEPNEKIHVVYPPRMGRALVLKALKGETNETNNSKS